MTAMRFSAIACNRLRKVNYLKLWTNLPELYFFVLQPIAPKRVQMYLLGTVKRPSGFWRVAGPAAPRRYNRYAIGTEGMGQMAQLALTDRFIAGAKSFEIQTDYFDDNPKTRGLCLRVTNGGRRGASCSRRQKGASAPA
jgi:hypothetical protein